MAEKAKIKNRKVFYFEGFDPRGVRYYHNLYKDESKKQTLVHKSSIEVSKRKKESKHVSTWQINYQKGKVKTNTEYSFLHWDDVVRYNWVKNPFLLSIYGFLFYVALIFSGAIFRLAHFALSVTAVILLPLLFIVFCFYSSNFIADKLYHLHGYYPLFFLSFLLLYYLVSRLNRLMNIFWLLRIYIFSAQYGFRENFLINARIGEFVKLIEKNLSGKKYDEVLLVGHSVGVLFLISTLAKLIENNPSAKYSIKVMSLGHCVQLVSLLPWSKKFREELKVVSQREGIYWLDVTSPVDGACIPFISPYFKVVQHTKTKLKIMNAGFYRMFGAKEYRKLKMNKFRIHFQYLMAGKKKTDYDFFEITASENNFINRFK